MAGVVVAQAGQAMEASISTIPEETAEPRTTVVVVAQAAQEFQIQILIEEVALAGLDYRPLELQTAGLLGLPVEGLLGLAALEHQATAATAVGVAEATPVAQAGLVEQAERPVEEAGVAEAEHPLAVLEQLGGQG
jgi:hypothetical protein